MAMKLITVCGLKVSEEHRKEYEEIAHLSWYIFGERDWTEICLHLCPRDSEPNSCGAYDWFMKKKIAEIAKKESLMKSRVT